MTTTITSSEMSAIVAVLFCAERQGRKKLGLAEDTWRCVVSVQQKLEEIEDAMGEREEVAVTIVSAGE